MGGGVAISLMVSSILSFYSVYILIAYRVTTVQYMKTFKEMICLDRNHNICMH